MSAQKPPNFRQGRDPVAARRLIRWLIKELARQAQGRGWVTISILIQDGQVQQVRQETSYTSTNFPEQSEAPADAVQRAGFEPSSIT